MFAGMRRRSLPIRAMLGNAHMVGPFALARSGTTGSLHFDSAMMLAHEFSTTLAVAGKPPIHLEWNPVEPSQGRL
jgi:hypothetical protein